MKCKCSAKVLQAFALFEMKCGHAQKSLFLVVKAVAMDETLAPVLKWKQFRDVESHVLKWKQDRTGTSAASRVTVDEKQALRP